MPGHNDTSIIELLPSSSVTLLNRMFMFCLLYQVKILVISVLHLDRFREFCLYTKVLNYLIIYAIFLINVFKNK